MPSAGFYLKKEYDDTWSDDLSGGTVVTSFNFHDTDINAETDKENISEKTKADAPIQMIQPTFAFRPSTVRLLNEHMYLDPDVNVYLSTIVDKALWHYYDSLAQSNSTKKTNKLYQNIME